MSKKAQSKKSIKNQVKIQDKPYKALPAIEPRFNGRIFNKVNPYIEIVILSFAIAVAAFALYYTNFGNNIVYCDDNIFIERFTKDINISKTLDTTIGTTFYRPVLNASFIIDAKSATKEGVDMTKLPPQDERDQLDTFIYPDVYHRTNLLLHIAGSILVLVAMVMLRFPIIHSFILSLIFTVHPILTPAVAWISGRNDSMITVFILLSFIFFINYIETPNKRNTYIFLVLHILFFVLSLYTKEIGIVFPLLCLLYIPYQLMYKNDRKSLKFKTLLVIPLWAFFGLIWYMMRKAAMSKIKSPDDIGFDALIKNFNSIPAMIGKIFIPHKMIALSSFESFSIITGWIFILAIVAAFFLLMKKSDNKDSLRNSYKIIWGFAWFVILLFPTLMIRIQYVDDFFDYAEHRAYLPLFGIFIIVSQLLVYFKVDFKKTIPLVVGLLIFFIFGAKSFTYKDSFHDRISFWSRMTEMYPEKSRGYYDLALGYKAKKDYKKAEELFMEAMKRNSENKKIYYELMNMYDKMGYLDKAVDIAQKMFQLDINNPVANFHYGKALYNKGRKTEAIPYLENAIRFGRNFPAQWYVLLGNAYTYNNQIQESVSILERALASKNIPDAKLYQGMNYYLLKDFNKSAEFINQALNANPGLYLQLLEFYDKQGNFSEVQKIAREWSPKVIKILSPYYYFVARAYLNTQETDKALETLRKGIAEYPEDKNLISLIGDCYLKTNEIDKAMAEFNKLIKINPDNADAYYYLGNAYALQNNNPKAHEAFDKSISLNPSNGNVYNSKAALYYKEKNFKKAEELWIKSIEIAPKDYGSYINLIKYYKMNNNKALVDKTVNELQKNGGILPPDLKAVLK